MRSGPGALADVLAFPVRSAASGARVVFEWSDNQVDDWGRDPDFVGRMWTLSRLRWDISVGGGEHLPRRGGALLVVNSRRFALSPIYTALAVGGAVTRPVRFVGRPDTAPVGPILQRLGGLLTHVDEVTNVLRAGQLVVLGTSPTLTPRQAGAVDHRVVGAAVAAKVPAFPVASMSAPFRRSARVEIGPAVPVKRTRRGPLAELELADELGVAIQGLLDEFGGIGGI